MSMVQHRQFDLRDGAAPRKGDAVDAVLLERPNEDNSKLLARLNVTNGLAVRSVSRSAWPESPEGPDVKTPDLLLVDAESGTPEDIEFIRRLKANSDNLLPVIALVERGGAYATAQATTAGADAVIEKPVAARDLREILSRPNDGSRVPAVRAVSDTKIVVFMHMTGGAGATTLAVNVACSLAQANPHRETCLLDMDLQFGSCAMFLDLANVSPIADFIQDPSRMDAMMLEGMMAQHPSGLRVLTSPRLPMPLDALTPACVDSLLRVGQERYRNIVVDMPATLTLWTDTVLRAASAIYLVTPMTVPAAHRLTKFLELLRKEKLAHLPVKIVINRSGSRKNSAEIDVAQFSKAVGQTADHFIPNDYALISLSQDQGTPALRLKPKSPFSVAVQKMVDEDINGFQVPKRSRKFGLFKS